MKIVVLWSSPNRDGLTASAKNRVIKGLQTGGAEVEDIQLNHYKIEHCMACGNGFGKCRAEGSCILKDDFSGIYQKLVDADGMVLVSAVYWHDMTECMKAFFDRMRRVETAHNRYCRDKRVILVACAGGTGLGSIECLHNMEQTVGHMGMRAYDRLSVIRYNQGYMLEALEKAGENYALCLRTGFDMQY